MNIANTRFLASQVNYAKQALNKDVTPQPPRFSAASNRNPVATPEQAERYRQLIRANLDKAMTLLGEAIAGNKDETKSHYGRPVQVNAALHVLRQAFPYGVPKGN